MKKFTIILLFALGFVVISALIYNFLPSKLEPIQIPGNINGNQNIALKEGFSAKNTSYIIDGQKITLINGQASEGKIKIFDEEAGPDLDFDAKDDTVVILTQDNDGSSTFYYAAVALNTEQGYIGTNGILLGDRIVPQNISFKENLIIVNYADRLPEDPMTTPPTVGTSKYLAVENNSLIEIPYQNENIILKTPTLGSVISSPLTISGLARGAWYFEASFPLILVDWDGKIIAESYATAKDDWMTEDFVEFEGQITFDQPEYGSRGALILKKDNPSGLPEYDEALEIPIFFK
ncbi:Gmad2 immunoglobulin-like domain-containing protein [Patescibacteria group bacterium]|nr:Gmad2 immunoglobulin-like domain-containing protein [Patescibacteria group bacterium]